MNLIEWLLDVADKMGGPGVALLIFLENIFPPIPSEVILPTAGVTVGRGQHSFLSILLFATLGSLVGAWVLYGIGYAIGAERVRGWFDKLPLIEVEDFDKVNDWFSKHGNAGVFFGRFVPGIRSLISIPAGTYKMPILQFSALTAIGSAIWNAIFIGFGAALGTQWHIIEPYTDLFSKFAYAVIAGLILWFIIKRIMRNRRRDAQATPEQTDRQF